MTSNQDPLDETFDFDDVTIPPVDNLGDAANQYDDATVQGPTTGAFETLPPDPTAPLASSVGTRVRYFGDYELLTEIARGGMGVVYRARQNKLNRIVALKMILAGQFASEEDVQRFYTEAAAAALLDHPGIVPVYEVGEHQGQHFFSMGFVEGTSLAARITSGPLPPREAAALLKLIAEAIAYAHSKGVIHRDLKPANVLLDLQGTPKVTDFGLAKNMESESGLTRTGSVMGTPSYMPPEQAGGANDQVGPRSDVYSLGAMLYCLLTGRPPFQAANPLDTLLQVMTTEPVPPRQLNPQVPKDLETICVKCLQKDPSRRYESATALAADLGRYHRGEPIHARSISRSERTWRWCKRNPVVASLTAAVALVLVLGTAISSYFALHAHRSSVQADERTHEALENLDRAEVMIYSQQIAGAQSAITLGDATRARELLDACRWDLRGWEHDHLFTVLSDGPKTSTFGGSGAPPTCTTISADVSTIAFGHEDGTIRIWSSSTGKETCTLSHDSPVRAVALSPDGKRLASSGDNGNIKLWNVDAGQAHASIELGTPLPHIVLFSPDGRWVVSGNAKGEL